MTTANSQKPIPITVFTGFLGAGKTSLILSLLPRLPKDYKVVLLKNEFGDVEGSAQPSHYRQTVVLIVIFWLVDSQLAKQSSLTAVSEILNGCMLVLLILLFEARNLYFIGVAYSLVK